MSSELISALSGLFAVTVSLVGVVLTRRGQRETSQVEQTKADASIRASEIEALKSSMEIFRTALDQSQEEQEKVTSRVAALERELAEVRADLAVKSSELETVRCELSIEQEYVRVLIDDIKRRAGPPIPERPQKRRQQ